MPHYQSVKLFRHPILLFCFLFCAGGLSNLIAQDNGSFTTVSLGTLDAFKSPGANWVIAGDAQADYAVAGDMKPVKGSGVIVNEMSAANQSHLFTKDAFGDLELELEFMMARQSNSGVYLQGRYEVQLFDSWTKLPATSADCGGIYQRFQPGRGVFEGTAPIMNVARAPGLWQQLRIKFRAPKFDAGGKKITNALFEEVYLNGVLVQQNVQVTGPTVSAMFPDETTTGPVVWQGDHGKVAFRKIRYRALAAPVTPKEMDYWQTRNSIIVEPNGKPSFIKTFLNHGEKKLTHVISVGHPNQANYSYNLKTGALFQVWRGDFIDVTKSWEDRGGEQLGTPLGSLVSLADVPTIAVLKDETAAWPDSAAFDDVDNKGYVLNKERSPVFEYVIKGIPVKDSVVIQANGQAIVRTITVTNPPAGLYCLIAKAKNIQITGSGMYVADDKTYYIKINSSQKPVIRQAADGQELLVKYDGSSAVNYSFIW